jgi:crotonobetainyl-CoA:carnitine CoA-transferase CaiB-like acyl-CoA transferase
MRPLEGIKVLDLSRLLPGPFATLVLADLGARVDKIEDPGGGDYLRHMPPAVAGESAAFHLLNRGKRSAVLDLKRPEAQAALREMLPRYDVLFEQFRPGVLDRLGLGHRSLLEQNPRLVVCALTGYGQTGPLAHRAGHDLNYLAASGLLGAQGPAEGNPAVPAWQLADVSGGMWCALSMIAALRERDRTGAGTILDVSMTDGLLGFATTLFGATLAGQPYARGGEPITGGIALYSTYRAKDGGHVTLAALEPKFAMGFAAAVGLEMDLGALIPGPHQLELKQKIAAIFEARTRAEWAEFAAKHDVCVMPVLEPGEIPASELHRARGLTFEMDTPRGKVPQVRLPVTPEGASFAPPPRAGEHTREILREGGLSEERIEALIASGGARQG